MDSSLQSANLTADELNKLTAPDHAETESAEEEHHIHMPNPSLWPFILSAAILVTVTGLLFLPDLWLSIIGAPFILFGIMGWALEDSMAPPKVKYVLYPSQEGSGMGLKFAIGQDVVDKNEHRVGTVQARFHRYILVEHGGLFGKVYYVPQSAVKEPIQQPTIHLTLSEAELRAGNLSRVPDDLYEESPDLDLPKITGIPMFARGPLSPAQTGHYNYGPNYPGINTDASGSYHREEVVPVPQNYVGERRKVYATEPKHSTTKA